MISDCNLIWFATIFINVLNSVLWSSKFSENKLNKIFFSLFITTRLSCVLFAGLNFMCMQSSNYWTFSRSFYIVKDIVHYNSPCWSANWTGLLILLLFLVMSSLMSSSFSTMSSLGTCLISSLDSNKVAEKWQTLKSLAKQLTPANIFV